MSSCTLSGEMEEDHAAIFFNKGGKLYAAGIDLSDKSHPIEWRARLFATVECHRPTDHGVTMVDTLEG